MRGLLSLQPVQGCPVDLPRLHRGLAVLGQVLTGRGVVVNSQAHFGAASAEQCVGQDKVANQEAGGVVGGAGLAFGGTEAEGSKNGSVKSFSTYPVVYHNLM